MSRDHLLPRAFRRLSQHRTPVNGVLITVALILLMVTVLDPMRTLKSD